MLENFLSLARLIGWGLVFQTSYDTRCFAGLWLDSKKQWPTQRHATVVTCQSSGSRCDTLSCSMLFQTQKSLGFDVVSKKFFYLQYFESKVEARKVLGLEMILQACLPKSALFILLVFLIPSPPLALLTQILSQLLKWSFLSIGSCPHQKHLATWSIF